MSVFELLAASPGLFVGTCLILGLLVGSFLNVVIHRKPIIMMREWLLDFGGMLGDGEV